jgi:hypothetical protein
MRGQRRVILPIVLTLLALVVPSCDLQPRSTGPTLEVLSPQGFARVQLGESVDVVSTASDPLGVTRVELYVGEDLYRTDGSPSPEGETSWTFTQTWMPTAPGLFTLTVVAYNRDGDASTPWAIAAEVVEGAIPEGTPLSTTPLATGTAPPVTTGTAPPPPPATGTVPPPPPPTGAASPPPPPTDTVPPTPPPTDTPPPMADLYVAQISTDPEEPRVGEPVQLRVVIRNGGNAPGRYTGGGIWVLTPYTQLFTLQSGLVAPGEEFVLAAPFTFSEPGLTTIGGGIGIHPTDQDANEENNTAELTFNVQPAVVQLLPDLLISRVTLDPSSPRVGEEVEVEVEISNAGTANAGRHTVTWKSDPNTIGCSWRVDGVPAGMNIIKRCDYVYTYPHSGQSTYTKADANGDIEELDEDNNVRYLRVNVRPAS